MYGYNEFGCNEFMDKVCIYMEKFWFFDEVMDWIKWIYYIDCLVMVSLYFSMIYIC